MDAFASLFQAQPPPSGRNWSYESHKNFRQISPVVRHHLKQVIFSLQISLPLFLAPDAWSSFFRSNLSFYLSVLGKFWCMCLDFGSVLFSKFLWHLYFDGSCLPQTVLATEFFFPEFAELVFFLSFLILILISNLFLPEKTTCQINLLILRFDVESDILISFLLFFFS